MACPFRGNGFSARVIMFDWDSCQGEVRGACGRYAFSSTIFHCDTQRWPRIGERVSLVFNQVGDLLAVHARED